MVTTVALDIPCCATAVVPAKFKPVAVLVPVAGNRSIVTFVAGERVARFFALPGTVVSAVAVIFVFQVVAAAPVEVVGAQRVPAEVFGVTNIVLVFRAAVAVGIAETFKSKTDAVPFKVMAVRGVVPVAVELRNIVHIAEFTVPSIVTEELTV